MRVPCVVTEKGTCFDNVGGGDCKVPTVFPGGLYLPFQPVRLDLALGLLASSVAVPGCPSCRPRWTCRAWRSHVDPGSGPCGTGHRPSGTHGRPWRGPLPRRGNPGTKGRWQTLLCGAAAVPRRPRPCQVRQQCRRSETTFSPFFSAHSVRPVILFGFLEEPQSTSTRIMPIIIIIVQANS